MADLTLSTNPPNAGDALTSQDQADIRAGLGLGSAAVLDAPASGDAASGQAVKGNDSRLTDARTPSGAAIAAATSKTTPVDADSLPISDSAASGGLKRLTWANVKAALKTYFDGIYQAVLVSGTSIKTINGTSLLGSGDVTVGGGSGATNLSYTASPTNGIVVSDTGTDATVPLSDGTNAGLMAPAQHTKLAGIAAGATANATDAQLRDRATHTGTQSAATITGLATVATSGIYTDLTGRPSLATVATSGAYGDLTGRPTLGTAAPLDVAASGNASGLQVVKGDDTRLSDARTPTAHTQAASTISDSTVAGRALLTAADAAAQRSSLGLGTAATSAATAFAASGAITGSGLTQATARLIGRTTAGTGAPEEISVSSDLTLSSGVLSPASNVARLATAQTFTAAQRGTVVALTDAATVAVDFAAGNFASVTLAGNRTLGNPTNQGAGQSGAIFITQDGTGSRTLAYSSNWKFAGGTAPSLSTTANAVDRLDYVVQSSGFIHANLTKDIK